MLITGVSDACQVLINYSTAPQTHMIIFRLTIANMTSNLMENIEVSFQTSANLKVLPLAGSNLTKISKLSTEESTELQVDARITSFD